MNLNEMTIEKAHQHLIKGDFSARELTEAYLKNIKEKNEDFNIYLEVFDDVLKQADQADKLIKEGKSSLMTGIPMAIKDNILMKGKKVSASSKILKGYKATYDAGVIKRLKESGAIFLGRTNMDEFAMGSSTENSAYSRTKNPIDPNRVPGGSSGGSAVAVAMNGALCALGSETGGSIRQPASFCGIVGLKTTYGAVSRSGLIAMASSLDQIGPLTKTVADAEIVFNIIRKKDILDSTSVDYQEKKYGELNKMRIGVPRDFLKGEGINKEVLDNFKKSLQKLELAGHKIIDLELPLLKYSLAIYYILMPAEASSNLARFDGLRYGSKKTGENLFNSYLKTRRSGFGKEVRRRIMLGTYVLSHGYYDAYYNKANKLKKIINNDLIKSFKEVDVIITPTSPFPAFKAGEKIEDPMVMYYSDFFTVPANITGIPAISIPSGKTKDNLPLGVQFMAPHFREDLLFKISKEFLLIYE